VVKGAGIEVDGRRADIGIIVGGDGVFSRCGRMESIPLLFVGVRSKTATGSKAYLAEAYFDELPDVLRGVSKGEFKVKEFRRLRVLKSGRDLGEVFTDVYLQRGAESNCLRYRVKVTGGDAPLSELAIGDGVVVSTAAGATGYYSYPDKIRGDNIHPEGHSSIATDEVGICHLVPTYVDREGSDIAPLRYKVSWGSVVELSITRRADARLYGLGPDTGGVRVELGDKVSIVPSERTTKVISLGA
jgi:hypothetical protein